MPLAMIICDQVITDRGSNNKTLVGTFNMIVSSRFPAVHPRMAVFVALHGGNGDYEASLRMEREGSGSTVFTAAGPIRFKDPMTVVEIAFDIRGVKFEEPGFYCLEFACDGEHVFSRRIQVIQKKN